MNRLTHARGQHAGRWDQSYKWCLKGKRLNQLIINITTSKTSISARPYVAVREGLGRRAVVNHCVPQIVVRVDRVAVVKSVR